MDLFLLLGEGMRLGVLRRWAENTLSGSSDQAEQAERTSPPPLSPTPCSSQLTLKQTLRGS